MEYLRLTVMTHTGYYDVLCRLFVHSKFQTSRYVVNNNNLILF